MTTKQMTIIVTEASQGIGAAVADPFRDRGDNALDNSRRRESFNPEGLIAAAHAGCFTMALAITLEANLV
jgi:organic hydroperoxide reductase OsmC/OhrA